jgi:anti-sigma regulatory factor (Ser/Thr protein kinase)
MSTDSVKSEIIFLAKHHRIFSVADIKHELEEHPTRQYISKLVNELVQETRLVKMGKGRWTKYALPEEAEKLSQRVTARLSNNKALDEGRVYADFKLKVAGLQNMTDNVGHIINYGFTEMLNNAIEHSGSKGITVGITADPDAVGFRVSDKGIGVFRNVMTQRKLANELEAIQDLTKGKITTKKEGHTGEGIFFTSRVADLFVLESYGYRLRIDNTIPDIFVEKTPGSVHGTLVEFTINRNSNRDLGAIFRRYQVDPDEGEFDVTEIKVKLYKENTEYISRSQAKRLLVDLDKFKRIVLDFEDVQTVGQGFADEIFRVFQASYPEIELVSINMNNEIAFMVNRVEKPVIKLL